MDRRQEKTRAAIFDAFESLLNEKKYSRITVKDIIEKANIGRTTFYEHFETKDELLSELCGNLFNHIISDHPNAESSHDFSFSEGDPQEIITHMLYHLKDGRKNIIRLLSGESGDIFINYFRSYLNDMAVPFFMQKIRKSKTDIPEDFLQNHISGSFVNMIRWWTDNGMRETPENLAAYFIAVTEPVL